MSAIGQAGTISDNTTFTGEPIVVSFDQPITDPVIALMSTNVGGNKFSLRLIDIQTDSNGDATGFRFTIDEWENEDGPHPAVEDINWLAIASGVHTLPDGRVIEAGYAQADSNGEPVSLTGSFGSTPTVLTTVASNDGTNVVDSDPFGISQTGFTIDLEEAESEDGVHGLETVGWIAVEPGGSGGTSGSTASAGVTGNWANDIGLGASYSNPITVAETQTQNGGDPGNVIFRNQDSGDIDLRFEEETSRDSETNHTTETVGLVTFEEGLILCFTDGAMVDTPYGPRPIEALRPGALILTQDEGPQPLLWTSSIAIGSGDIAQRPEIAPILITAGALGAGRPARDIRVSPQHRILFEGWQAQLYAGEDAVLVPARALVNGTTIRVDTAAVRYVHLLFDTHQVITSDGLASESLHPGQMARSAFAPAARAELFSLFPELATASVGYGPTARPALSVRAGALFAA
ncbi:MAG: Hint domain-containing protein [Pseudomonadota bacterium]